MPEMMEWFEKGGPTLKVIAALSILGLACIIYGLLLLRRRLLLPRPLLDLTRDASQPTEELIKVCEDQGGPFADILYTVLVTRELPQDEAEPVIEAAGRRAIHTLSKTPLMLEVIAAISPLLGLLGTVIGMYACFDTLVQSGVKDMALLSNGIKEALITTIAGLIVAIPAYVASTWFNRRCESLVLEMERHAIQLMTRLRKRD